MASHAYDLVVIGAGPVGENVADRAVRQGLTAVIVESELVGGECSYWACMPSKALLRAPAARDAARAVAGVETAEGIDVAALLARRDGFTHDWSDASQVEWLESAGIDLVRGHGRLKGERTVEVTGADGETRTLSARHAVAVCTGSAALLPDIPGLVEARPWTSREATSVHEVPASVVIIGGGVVACEMATVYLALGSDVTVLARSGLLGGMEPFAGERVAEALRAGGAHLQLSAAVERVSRDAAGVQVVIADAEPVRASEVIVATGRTPRTEDLGLETVGLAPGAWLDVDETLRVHGSEWLYAVGDVNHRALLTHQGKYQARAAGDVIAARAAGGVVDDAPWGVHAATADHDARTQVVFTIPEVASVGRTQAQAERDGIAVRALDVDLSGVAGAATHADGYAGMARAVVDVHREVLIGATFVGPDVAELVQAAAIAVAGEVPLRRLWHAVPAYPTISEVWLRWLEAYGRPDVG